MSNKNNEPRSNNIPVEFEGDMDEQGPSLLIEEFEKALSELNLVKHRE